jgi:hypothetical protein
MKVTEVSQLIDDEATIKLVVVLTKSYQIPYLKQVQYIRCTHLLLDGGGCGRRPRHKRLPTISRAITAITATVSPTQTPIIEAGSNGSEVEVGVNVDGSIVASVAVDSVTGGSVPPVGTPVEATCSTRLHQFHQMRNAIMS